MSTQATTTTSVMGSSVDPASLRAAALSTLKKKVKRPVKQIPDLKSTLPRPPPPSSDSFLLDYGQDESSQDVTMSSTIPAQSSNVPPVLAKDRVLTIEDVLMREEGEISEEEEPPPPRGKLITSTHSPVLPVALEPAAVIKTSLTSARSRSPEFQPTSPVSLIDRIFPAVNQELQVKQPENVSMSVDCAVMNFVRPGVALSQEEYDTVKDLILDLLGWGVPPAAIMDSGVSREVMFYVFNELNLRLPEDFDYAGIPPYTPAMAMEPSTSDHSPISSFAQQPVASVPAESAPCTTVGDAESALLDMERQRRKELLARKAAVLASRKSKKPTASIRTHSSINLVKAPSPQLDAPATPIASEAVEDFLNSIGPGHHHKTETEIPAPYDIRSDEPDAMEVDLQPHADASKRDVSTQNTKPTTLVADEPHDLVSIADEPFIEPPVPVEPPPWSGDSMITTFSEVSTGSYSGTVNPPIRRGTKRPVASDFVDMEPSRYRSEISVDRRIQKPPRFNNLQTMRCVIELSDDEDSDDEHHTPLPSQPSTPMPYEPRTVNTRERWNKQNGQLPQVPAATSILHLKELEIQRMREMIAKKEEETRLKKLTLASKASLLRSASGTPAPSAPTPPSKDADTPNDAHSEEMIPAQLDDDGDVDAAASPTSTGSSSNDKPPCIPDQDTTVSLSASEPPEEDSLAVTPAEEHAECEVSVHSEVDDVDVERNQLASAQATSMLPPDHLNPDEKRVAISDLDSQDAQIYSEYRSPFTLYPRLSRRGMDTVYRVSSHESPQASTVSFFPSTKLSDSSTTSPSTLKLDLQPLKFDAIIRSIDPFKRLCQYEIPGPGVCLDKGCEDIHLSKLEALEPDDNETADYVFKHLPHNWANKHQVKSASVIFQALQAVRQKNSKVLSLDECVGQALRFIGSFPAT